jgi:hypothetical protein
MRGVAKLLLATAVAALLASGFAACGSDSNGDNSTAVTSQTTPATTTTEGPGSPSDEASASFRTPGGDNSIQNFGEEADSAEVEAATTTLTAYLQARAEEDWVGACTNLARETIEPLEQLASRSPRFKGKGCATILAAFSAGTPSSVNTLADGIASLRAEGERGFALYHGAEGADYFIPMTKENGEWKVGALAPSEFP